MNEISGHDFSQSNKCRYCGANIMFAEDECSGNMGEAIDSIYDSYSDK